MMYGEHTLTIDLEFETDSEWDIEGSDYSEEFKEAVERVRDDHDAEPLIEADNLYNIRVRYNEPTDEIRFDVMPLSETFIVKEDHK